MSRRLRVLLPLLFGATFIFAIVFLPVSLLAEPSFFNSDCASCHSDDTPTCDGCHMHRGNLSAVADMPEYGPGDPVTVTLNGGSRGGWIRGLLYDEANVELDLVGGPTGTGDDGQGSPNTFPVQLHAMAPVTPGDYTWEAAWYGNNNGNGHIERRTSVVIHVMDNTAVPDDGNPFTLESWGKLKRRYR